jgi:hypothetical protein
MSVLCIKINIRFPPPEENAARPECVGYLFSVCFVASGLSQPRIIRLRRSGRVRIKVSGNRMLEDRRTTGRTDAAAVMRAVPGVIYSFCFTLSE